jgi:predicted nucleic acid-binding protein
VTVERVVLDAAGLAEVPTSTALRALLRRTAERGGQVWCAAVTIAEVARGPARTARVHVVLGRRFGGRRILVQPTDERLALLVGALLHDSGRGSHDLADAHVVAVCAPAAVALVVTSDPDDIAAIGGHLPGVRIRCVRPDRLAHGAAT